MALPAPAPSSNDAALPPVVVPASRLERGASGVVHAVEGASDRIERLAAMGLVPGAYLRVVRGGSPMAVAVGEARYALGADWAEALLVERL